MIGEEQNKCAKELFCGFSQDIFSEDDKHKNCEIYPIEMFSTYAQCDNKFVINTF